MLYADFLERPVAYYPVLARLLGSATSAIMLSQALYWQRRVPENRPIGCPGPDWWYHSASEWANDTALTKNEQLTARKKLVKTGFWHEKRAGLPARMWFWVDLRELGKILSSQQFTARRTTRCTQCRLADGRFMENVSSVTWATLHAESTAEITTTGHGHSDNQSPTRDSDQENYLRLAMIYEDINNPTGFKITKKKRWKTQGGLSVDDKLQLADWLGMVEKEKTIAATKEAAMHDQEIKDQQCELKALECEAEMFKKLDPSIQQSLLIMQAATRQSAN